MKRILPALGLLMMLMMLSSTTRAQYLQKQADDQYTLYNYSQAVELYTKIYKKTPTLYIAEHIANCYYMMHDYPQTETWYATVNSLPDSPPTNVLKYAQALQSNAKYALAKAQYTKYYTLTNDVDRQKLRFYTSACDSAIKWMKSPSPVDINNEQLLNSDKSDFGAVKYRQSVVFTSDRENKTASTNKGNKPFLWFDTGKYPDKTTYGWTGNRYLDLYQWQKGGTADSLKAFPLYAGTDYHIGAATFTADGNEMYFTLTRVPGNLKKDKDGLETINLEVYSSKRDPRTQKWGSPVAFKYNNADKWSVGDPFISADGQSLYFVSNMPGGVGGTDIYRCIKDDQGNWTDLVNLKAINTAGNERTPFIDSAKNIYFSSDGDKGMGGLDVYKAVRVGSSFGPKQNLGFPINSPQDDFSYTMYSSVSGYFASNRPGGVGSDDIYSFTYKPVISYKLEGIVYDKNTQEVLGNSMVSLSAGNSTLRTQTNNEGKYSFAIPEKLDYKLKGELTGYLSDNKIINSQELSPVVTLKKDLYLEKIVLNKAIKIENIYYDFDKSNIRPDAAIELDKLVKVLRENPTIKIELGSHTDSRGDDEYNMTLSRKRANAAVEYIISVGGIDEERIVARGYGETQLLNRCANGVKCTEPEHQLNRRTEFKIIQY